MSICPDTVTHVKLELESGGPARGRNSTGWDTASCAIVDRGAVGGDERPEGVPSTTGGGMAPDKVFSETGCTG